MSGIDRRPVKFTLRLTDGEYDLIHQRAKAHGFVARSSGRPMPGRYIREKVFNVREDFLTIQNISQLFEWRTKIRKLENNMCQVTQFAYINSQRFNDGQTDAYYPIPPALIDQFHKDGAELKNRLDELEDIYVQILAELCELKEKHGISTS